ncbi:hypothetical protein GW933_01880 [Candidatus Falkowbacteria bacterium]|nr:hypothetical protein [Candidatus Falkowbacteria bacterium]
MRKLNKQNIRKLGKTGRGVSFTITVPIQIIRDLKWREGQKVIVKKSGLGISIKDWTKK